MTIGTKTKEVTIAVVDGWVLLPALSRFNVGKAQIAYNYNALSIAFCLEEKCAFSYSHEPYRRVDNGNGREHINCTVEGHAFGGLSKRRCIEQLFGKTVVSATTS